MLVGVFFACENDTAEIAKYDLSNDFPDQAAKDVEILYSTEGNVAFQLNAPVLNQYTGEKAYNEMPEGVHVQIFDSLLNVTTDLTSNYAIQNSQSNTMEAKGNVVVINEKGEKLETEHLVWDQKTEKISSDVFVTITTKNQTLEGDGLISNQDFTDYRILNPVGTIKIEDD